MGPNLDNGSNPVKESFQFLRLRTFLFEGLLPKVYEENRPIYEAMALAREQFIEYDRELNKLQMKVRKAKEAKVINY